MKKIIKDLKILCWAIKYSISSWYLTVKGQLPRYEILQLSHRIEKGILNKSPKPMWGWEKARRLADLLQTNKDPFSTETGQGVLAAYINLKLRSSDPEERSLAELFTKQYGPIQGQGGAYFIDRSDVILENKLEIEKLFHTRHSVRDFSDKKVSQEDINSAIALALSCPSACNRQPTKCYVYQSDEQQTIVLTVNIRAYDSGEFNDWFVSPSIFAAYLSLTMHLYGIGSCIFRKQLYGNHPYNIKMRKLCDIPEEEMIIIELKFGYYKDRFEVACSNRTTVEDITSYTCN